MTTSHQSVEQLLQMLGTGRDSDAAVSGLAALGVNAVEPVLDALRHRGPDARPYQDWEQDLRDVIVRIGSMAVPLLIRELENTTSTLRFDVAWMLGPIGDDRAIEPLIAALRDEDEWLRWAVVHSLAAFRTPQVIDVLIHLFGDSSLMVRGAAANAVGQIGHRDTASCLSRLVGMTSDDNVRSSAQRALDAIVERLSWNGDLGV